jgi:hypothetical protein
MPTHPFDPSKIGAYKRSYDAYLDNSDDQQELDVLKEVRSWTSELHGPKQPKFQPRELFKSALEAVLGVAGLPGGKTGAGVSLVDHILDVAEDLYFAARDLFTGRRIKTSLIIVGGIVLGAVAGALIGTLIMPGIGSAIGGAMGVAAIGTFLSVGGTIGLSLLGASGGSWLGAKISDVAFKGEKRYELSHRRTRRIKKYLGISEEDAEIINGYLINRRKTIAGSWTKRDYKVLKDELIEKPESVDLRKALNFFKNELVLLEKERDRIGSGSPIPHELDQEIKSVVYILNVISKSKQFYKIGENEQLQSLLAKYDSSKPANAAPSLASAPVPVPVPVPVKPVLSKMLHQIHSKDKDIFAVYKRELTETNKELVSDELAAEALEYSKITGNKSPTVMAGGDDRIAIRLLAAAIKAGLTPQLNETEYPDEEHRFKLLEDAYKLADKVMQVSQSGSKVGYKYTT